MWMANYSNCEHVTRQQSLNDHNNSQQSLKWSPTHHIKTQTYQIPTNFYVIQDKLSVCHKISTYFSMCDIITYHIQMDALIWPMMHYTYKQMLKNFQWCTKHTNGCPSITNDALNKQTGALNIHWHLNMTNDALH